MNVKNTTGAFRDCFATMDKMLRAKGGEACFPTSKAATVFRHRCYKARNMLYKAALESTPPGLVPGTPYDDLFIQHEPGSTTLRFNLRSQQLPELKLDTPLPRNFGLDLDLE